MFDGSVPRQLAGYAFRRADTLRDERDDETERPVEAFLRNWMVLRLVRHADRAALGSFADRIAAVAQDLRQQDDAAVAQRFLLAAQELRQLPGEEAPLVPLLACVGEASRRVLGMWPHPVQFRGAALLMRGKLTEMQTGEGKTLVAALAATAMAGCGAAVHVVSANDYLAHRDAEEMSPLFAFFGLAVGSVREGMEAEDRRSQYARHIAYVSGKELVFDYLKDRLAGHGYLPTRVAGLRSMLAGAEAADAPLIPALHFAIVDEADSVLIDEARTPLILSREAPGLYEAPVIEWAIAQARGLREGEHFRIGAERQIELLPPALPACGPLPPEARRVWERERWQSMLLRQALTALHLFTLDQHYIIAEGKVQIVDESTGRVMADRSWEQGLHQLIECKEQLEQTGSRETLARMTYQRFFRRYFLLSGLTGTAAEAAREVWSVYRLQVERLPPHRPNLRRQLPARCLPTASEKWQAVAAEAIAASARGQPVLVGTRSVEASEAVSLELQRRGVAHVVLNARQDQGEADIVTNAGRSGQITVATNMAGRGTDIRLEAQAKACGGLHVILTEYHGSPRVDRQLFGRCGRQGDPGSTRALVSADDELFRHYAGQSRRLLMQARISAAQASVLKSVVRWSQWRAESKARKIRLQTFKQDKTLHQRLGFAGRLL